MEQLNFRQKKELDKLINQVLFKPRYRLKKASLLVNHKKGWLNQRNDELLGHLVENWASKTGKKRESVEMYNK